MSKGPKKVSYEVVPDESPEYERLAGLVAESHDHLANARIALAWNTGWKDDADGRITLGQCKKVSDLDRELHEFDFVIVLNREYWNAFNDAQRDALLDHELCHAQAKVDEHGEQEQDERGRPVWRIRKHDVEEFGEIVKRHGLWKHDLELFARAMAVRAQDGKVLDLFAKGGTVNGEEIGLGKDTTVTVTPGFLAGIKSKTAVTT